MKPNYLLGLLIFFSIQYGPHTALFPQFFEINKITELPQTAYDYYILTISLVYLIFALLVTLTPKALLRCDDEFANHKTKAPRLVFKLTLLAAILITISLSLPNSITIISEHLLYLLGKSNFSYAEIRRELFGEAAWSSFASAVRFAIIPLVGGGLFLAACNIKSPSKKFGLVLLSASVPLLTSIQLNKLFYAYYLLLYAYIYQCTKHGVPSFTANPMRLALSFWKIAIYCLIGSSILLALYYFQYSVSLKEGSSTAQTLLKTLIYRIFFASADGLAAWINYFAYTSEPIGLAGIGKLCNLFSSHCIDAPLFTAIEIIGSDKTSIQTGFMGSGFSSFGIIGTIIYTFIAYFIGLINNYVLLNYRKSPYFPVLSGVMFINAFFLTTAPTHTAMLSGGAVLTPLFAVALFSKLVRFSRRRITVQTL